MCRSHQTFPRQGISYAVFVQCWVKVVHRSGALLPIGDPLVVGFAFVRFLYGGLGFLSFWCSSLLGVAHSDDSSVAEGFLSFQSFG